MATMIMKNNTTIIHQFSILKNETLFSIHSFGITSFSLNPKNSFSILDIIPMFLTNQPLAVNDEQMPAKLKIVITKRNPKSPIVSIAKPNPANNAVYAAKIFHRESSARLTLFQLLSYIFNRKSSLVGLAKVNSISNLNYKT